MRVCGGGGGGGGVGHFWVRPTFVLSDVCLEKVVFLWTLDPGQVSSHDLTVLLGHQPRHTLGDELVAGAVVTHKPIGTHILLKFA